MMIDREKVIKAIETHISTDDSVGCDDCTYENDGWCMTRVLSDALALLKEQDDEIAKFCGEVARLTAMLEEQKAEIRQLKLALDIVKGTRKGISVEGW